MSLMHYLLVAVAAISSTAQGQIRYVDDGAPPGGGGLTWNTSYRFLQDALFEAAVDPGITEVRVAQGRYLPDRDEANSDGTGDRHVSFRLRSDLLLRGGYAGLGPPDPDARDVTLYATILSGDLAGDDGPNFANTGENSLHVVDGSGVFPGVAPTGIDGFTITGGNAAGVGIDDCGGGMLVITGSPSVIDCTFVANVADNDGGAMYLETGNAEFTGCTFTANVSGDQGGAMYNVDSSITLHGCTFGGNASDYSGGAIVNTECSVSLNNCTFEDNSAYYRGGAIENQACATVYENCTFTTNSIASAGSARHGGAIYNNGCANTMTGCAFVGNSIPDTTVNSGGGAIQSFDTTDNLTACHFQDNHCLLGGAVSHPDFTPPVEPLRLVGCTFLNNVAGIGGALHLQDSVATVLDCEIIGNQAEHAEFGHGGGVFVLEASELTMINTLVAGNAALGRGGGLTNWYRGRVSLINCTVAANVAADVVGGLYDAHGQGTVGAKNCILWGNSDGEGSGEAAQVLADGAPVAVDFSCIQGLTGALGGTGNIGADPAFADPDNGDFRLSADSPSIDAGHNWAVADLADTDLDGNPRFADGPAADTGCGVPVVVDMGAYEHQGDPFPVRYGDIDGDGAVSMADFLLLLDGWGLCADECCLADLDLDGGVGVIDFLILLAEWG